jgi:hypothetical protein
MAIKDWSTTAASNTTIDGINIAEQCPASGINDALRAMMSNIKSGLAGQWHLIATNTPSAAASTTFTGFDAAVYRDYMIVVEKLAPATDNTVLRLRTSTDGGSNYDSGASDYIWGLTHSLTAGGSGNAGSVNDDNDSEIELTSAGVGNAAGEYFSGVIEIINPGAAAVCEIIWRGTFGTDAGARVAVQGAGARNASANVDAVQLIFASGNIASGTVKFYGRRL